ncbi:hypothetical protein ACFIJ5_13785 [Haloimpatiens sp. FM7330]|uniref:hypothetical protein n=1 Tax=Haloimpatiens sp. FM7330 TaxID=3298610 RepID=UPI00363A4045
MSKIKKYCQTIGKSAFSLCYNVISITLGNEIKNIPYDIFLGPNDSIKFIINIFALVPPKLICFICNTPISIYVPPQSLELYNTAYGWRRYKDIIYPLVKKIIK